MEIPKLIMLWNNFQLNHPQELAILANYHSDDVDDRHIRNNVGVIGRGMAPREELAHTGDTFETFLGNGSVTNKEYIMKQARKLLFSLQWKYHDIREAS